MRKLSKFIMLLLSLALFVVLVACGDKVELRFTDSEVTIKVDEEIELEYELVGEDVTLEWTSSDSNIATVTDGKVKGIAVGEATITAKVKDKDVEASIKVKVEAKPVVMPTSVVISDAPTEAKVGENAQLKANVLPATASQEVEWSTSDEEVATVDQNGKVSFVGMGSVKITAKAKADTNIKHEVEIEVVAPDPTEIVVTTESGESTVHLYGTLQLIAVVNPEIAVDTVIWSSSNNSVAIIDDNGLLQALAVGKVTVTATSTVNDEIKGTKEIEVIIPAPSVINLSAPYSIIQVNEEMQLSFVVHPEVADKSVVYSSSDETIATVTETGKVVGVAPGDVVITVKSALDETVTSSVNVKVIEEIGEPEHNKIIVDETLKDSERFEKITIDEVDYYYGVNAFGDFGEFMLNDGSEIYVYPGTYTGNLLVDKNNVTIYSDNKDKDPNTAAFDLDNQAIIKGKITFNDGVEGLTINGLSFTETGKVEALGATKDFTFKNNYAFDIEESSKPWSALRDYTLTGFLTLWKQSKPIENAVVENNKFENIPATNVVIGNTRGITIKNNTFRNFGYDAVRIEGGYNYGKTLVEGNKFVNDELGGYNGVYFRAVGADKESYETNLNVIEVKNNYFKNIGQDELFSGAISTSTYQEFGAKLEITHNTFESCYNFLMLRNNATTENHNTYKWEANVNYNIFLGVPERFIHNNKNATDTATTNPALVNMDFNFFGDLDGNPLDLEDDAIKAKFEGVGSLEYTYTSIEAMDAIVVSAEWSEKAEDEEVFFDGMKFVFGSNAFATINDALEAVKAGGRIIVLPGTYDEDVEITKAVKLETMQAKLSPVVDDEPFKLDSETAVVITNVWSINNTSNVSIKGFTFTGAARVRQFGPEVSAGTRNFLFENNYVVDTDEATIAWKQTVYEAYGTTEKDNATIPGFISLAQHGTWMHDTRIIGNKFENVSDTHVYLLSVANAVIARNEFLGGDRDAIRFDYGSTYGYFDIYDNKFEDLEYNGIYIRTYTFQWGTPAIFNIERNTFKNIGAASETETPTHARLGAITAAYYAEKNSAEFNIRFNVFENNYHYITLRANANKAELEAAGFTWSANILYNAFIDSGDVEFYYQNIVASGDTEASNINNAYIDHNFYGKDAETKATITVDQFDNHLVDESNKVVYDTLADLEAAIEAYDEFVKPIVVDSKLADVEVGTKVTYFDSELEVGVSAFATLKEAVDAAVAGKIIMVLPGEYTETEAVEINVSDLRIYGPNQDVNPVTGKRNEEAVVFAKVILGEGVKNIEINGFKFLFHHTGSFVSGHENGKIDGFTFAYNIFDLAEGGLPSGANAPIKFIQKSAEQGNKNFSFLYNYIMNTRDDRGIRLSYIENLTVVGNKLENVNDAIRLRDENGGITGKLIVKDNEFVNIRQYAIFTQDNAEVTEIEITGNLFDGTGQFYTSGAISIRKLSIGNDPITVVIANNIFKNTKTTDIEVVHDAEEDDNITITIEGNEFHTVDSTIYTNRGTGVVKTTFMLDNKVFDAEGNEIDLATLFEGEAPRIKNASLEEE